jgi:hypothetical protein
VEDDFHVVHAVAESDGTMLQGAAHAAERLDEKLLIAVRACKRDDVKALLKQGATLHELAKATDLSIEMKTLLGESLAALYSAECDALSSYVAYKGSFINSSAPISLLLQRWRRLSLWHADGSMSEWNSSADRCYPAQACTFRFDKATTFNQSNDRLVSICARPELYRTDNAAVPDVAKCNSTGYIAVYTKQVQLLRSQYSTSYGAHVSPI